MDNEFQKLKDRVEKLEKARNLEFVELFVDEVFLKKEDVVDADITQTTNIGAGGGSVNHLVFPDYWLIVRYKGKPYRIALYPLGL